MNQKEWFRSQESETVSRTEDLSFLLRRHAYFHWSRSFYNCQTLKKRKSRPIEKMNCEKHGVSENLFCQTHCCLIFFCRKFAMNWTNTHSLSSIWQPCIGGELMTAPLPELFPWTHLSTPSTRLDMPQVLFASLKYDPTGNRTQPARFGGACSISCVPLGGL